jgi:hypothetical protein
LTSFFPENIIAGFTNSRIDGDPAHDMKSVLSFRSSPPGVAYMKQVHGSTVNVVGSPGITVCDGIFTRRKDLVLVVKTADCLPLIFHNEREGIIGAVHMGWRSAKEGILKNIPYALEGFKVLAGVGMRVCCFEVGDEFKEYAAIGPHLISRGARHYFDPVSFAKTVLTSAGLEAENFFDLGICSHCSGKGFFSHRKTATPNRTLTFIARSSGG